MDKGGMKRKNDLMKTNKQRAKAIEKIWYNKIAKLDSLSYSDYKAVHQLWFWIFSHYLTKQGFNKRAINQLFWWWGMSNWKEMHKENSEYANFTNEQLFKSFVDDVGYCSDRMSYDRLFRNHWKFRQVFKKDIDKKLYPYYVSTIQF